MKKVLITGGTGFIGRYVTQFFAEAGYDVSVVSFSGRKLNDYPNINVIQADFGDKVIMSSHLGGIDTVIHLAWSTVPCSSSDNPAYAVQSNLIATINLLDVCVEKQVKEFLFMSSGGTVYGIPKTSPIKEDHSSNPISAYGINKLAVENYLHFYHRRFGLNYKVLRVSNAYGVGQNIKKQQGVIGVWLSKIKNNEPIMIWGDGEVVRDYIHVKDVAKAVFLLSESEITNQVFNIASGEGASLNEILNFIKDAIDVPIVVEYQEARSIDVPVNILDVTRLKETINWTPSIGLKEGVKAIWDSLNS